MTAARLHNGAEGIRLQDRWGIVRQRFVRGAPLWLVNKTGRILADFYRQEIRAYRGMRRIATFKVPPRP